MLKEIHLLVISHPPQKELEKKTYTQEKQIKKEKPKKLFLMTMTGYVQAVVKFETMTEMVAG